MAFAIKRFGCLTLAALLLLGLSFSTGVYPSAAMGEEEPLKLVATIFPAYDFARVVAGSQAQVTLLLPPGGDSHSFEPTPQDIITIQNADLFLYVGGESDQWIERILDSMGQDAPRTFRLMDAVTVLSEELTASMEPEAHEHGEEAHEDEAELDEHVWTSPKNAMLIVDSLQQMLAQLSPANAAVFEQNASAYQAELAALDGDFEQAVAQGKRKTLVFGDRFPFRYFAAAYGLTCDAAFPGCSEDSEPSVQTIMSLVEVIQQEQIPVVFYIEFSSRKTADILAEETGAKELLFHSCHTVSAEEMEQGASYLSLMRGNLEALKEALN